MKVDFYFPSITFSEIKKFAESRWPEPVETTLLGKVRVARNERCEWVGVIPRHLAYGAAECGLEIFEADFKSNRYRLRLMVKPGTEGVG